MVGEAAYLWSGELSIVGTQPQGLDATAITLRARRDQPLDPFLQDVVEEPVGCAGGSRLSAERGSLIHSSQGREQRAVQFLRADSLHIGFGNELFTLFPDRALGG